MNIGLTFREAWARLSPQVLADIDRLVQAIQRLGTVVDGGTA